MIAPMEPSQAMHSCIHHMIPGPFSPSNQPYYTYFSSLNPSRLCREGAVANFLLYPANIGLVDLVPGGHVLLQALCYAR